MDSGLLLKFIGYFFPRLTFGIVVYAVTLFLTTFVETAVYPARKEFLVSRKIGQEINRP